MPQTRSTTMEPRKVANSAKNTKPPLPMGQRRNRSSVETAVDSTASLSNKAKLPCGGSFAVPTQARKANKTGEPEDSSSTDSSSTGSPRLRGRQGADIKTAVESRRKPSCSKSRPRSSRHSHFHSNISLSLVLLVLANCLAFYLQGGLEWFLPPVVTTRHLSVEQIYQLAVDSVSAILPLDEPGSCESNWESSPPDKNFSSAWRPSDVLWRHGQRIGMLCGFATDVKHRPDLTRLCDEFHQAARAAETFQLKDWQTLGAPTMLYVAQDIHNVEAILDDTDEPSPEDGAKENKTATAVANIYLNLAHHWGHTFRSLLDSITEYDNAIGLMEATEGFILDGFEMYVNKAKKQQQPKPDWRILSMDETLQRIRTGPDHCFVSRMRRLSADAVTALASANDKTALILQDLRFLRNKNWRLAHSARPEILDDHLCPACPPGSQWRRRHSLWVFDDLLTLRLSLEAAADKVDARVRLSTNISEATEATTARPAEEDGSWLWKKLGL